MSNAEQKNPWLKAEARMEDITDALMNGKVPADPVTMVAMGMMFHIMLAESNTGREEEMLREVRIAAKALRGKMNGDLSMLLEARDEADKLIGGERKPGTVH